MGGAIVLTSGRGQMETPHPTPPHPRPWVWTADFWRDIGRLPEISGQFDWLDHRFMRSRLRSQGWKRVTGGWWVKENVGNHRLLRYILFSSTQATSQADTDRHPGTGHHTGYIEVDTEAGWERGSCLWSQSYVYRNFNIAAKYIHILFSSLLPSSLTLVFLPLFSPSLTVPSFSPPHTHCLTPPVLGTTLRPPAC